MMWFWVIIFFTIFGLNLTWIIDVRYYFCLDYIVIKKEKRWLGIRNMLNIIIINNISVFLQSAETFNECHHFRSLQKNNDASAPFDSFVLLKNQPLY